jgi:Asp-tRNA(Asn)/Glu-tRNA(Gln) amidotransferase A subunit family amidase
MALSGNLDTLGWFARDAEDLALLGTVLTDAWPAAGEAGGAPAFALARTPWWDRADADAQGAVTRAAERLAAGGATVRDLDLPERFAALPEAQEALMAFDMARSLAHEHEHHADELSAVLRALLERGHTIDRAVAEDAVALGAECRALLAEHLESGETLLVPAVSGEPPAFDDGVTGDPLFCRPWTLLGVPALSVPGATGSHGAPVGVQFVAPARADAALVAAGGWAVRQLN